MPLFVATDEAGYGPKLGPLVVAASAWIVDSPSDNRSESRGVNGIEASFDAALAARTMEDGSPILLGDSKKLFQRTSSNPLALLEGPILAWLDELWAGVVPGSLDGLLEKLAGEDVDRLRSKPWFESLDSPVPIARIKTACTRLVPGGNVKLVGLAVRVIDASEFNRLSQICGNKATLLSEATVCLVRRLLEDLELSPVANEIPATTNTPTYVFSDRHGGRLRYAGLLQQFFPESMPSVSSESKTCSRYQLRFKDKTLDWRFSVKGDSFGPVAFSSMVAKYVRERMMEHFNQYWLAHHGLGLKPTAGYPLDATRFCEQIASTAKRLGIKDDQFIRSR